MIFSLSACCTSLYMCLGHSIWLCQLQTSAWAAEAEASNIVLRSRSQDHDLICLVHMTIMIRLTNALPMTVIALHYVCAGSEVLPPEYMDCTVLYSKTLQIGLYLSIRLSSLYIPSYSRPTCL